MAVKRIIQGGTIDVNGVEVKMAPEVLPLGNLKLQMKEPIDILPGKSAVIHTVRPFSARSFSVIVAMGVTQHPDTRYEYVSDGRVLKSLVPLGEFHTPLYTRQMLGFWLLVGEELNIIVHNDDVEAHKYGSIVWTFDMDKV